jgi:hypothetical protein
MNKCKAQTQSTPILERKRYTFLHPLLLWMSLCKLYSKNREKLLPRSAPWFFKTILTKILRNIVDIPMA